MNESGMSSRMSIPEIATRLSIGRLAVYTMLEHGIHSCHPLRPAMDRHPARLRELGAHLRDADWTSTENRA
jgi:hypothetical protein